MILAGKRSPEKKDIEAAILDEGFMYLEIHLDDFHLENTDAIKENIIKTIEHLEKKEHTIVIISFHTPHFDTSHPEYLKKTIDLARHFNAYTIFHSNKLTVEETLDIAKQISSADKTMLILENKTTMDIKSTVHNFIPDYDIALDIAHLYRASHNIYQDFELLMTSFRNKIKLIHLNDSTKHQDGLALGDGDIDIETIAAIIKKTGFSGPIIIETPTKSQQDSKEKFEKILSKVQEL